MYHRNFSPIYIFHSRIFIAHHKWLSNCVAHMWQSTTHQRMNNDLDKEKIQASKQKNQIPNRTMLTVQYGFTQPITCYCCSVIFFSTLLDFEFHLNSICWRGICLMFFKCLYICLLLHSKKILQLKCSKILNSRRQTSILV